MPHAPGAELASLLRPALTTERMRFTSVARQRGQEGVAPPETSSSSWCAQAVQTYS